MKKEEKETLASIGLAYLYCSPPKLTPTQRAGLQQHADQSSDLERV